MRGEFVDVGGVRLYYYAAGTRGAGDAIVLLHGFPTSAHLWSELVPRLPPGHRVVVVDMLGYGRSDPPGDADLSVAAHGARVARLFDDLTLERACVVGHDLGGGVAQWLATTLPARVTSLCLVNSVAFDAWPATPARLARLASPIASLLPDRLVHAAARRELLRGYRDRELGAHSIDLYLRPFVGASGRRALFAHLSALRGDSLRDVSAALPRLSVPTRVICGAADPFLPTVAARRLADAIPGATLQLIPQARHFIPEESPGTLASAIERLVKQ